MDRIVLYDPAQRRRLRAARRGAGLTQAEVARRLGVSRSRYHRFERGVGALPPDHWNRLASWFALDAPPDPAPPGAAIGALIAAARRRRRLSRRAVVDALRAIDPSWTAARLTRVEEARDPWPVAGCAALARLLEIDPAAVGLAPQSPVHDLVAPLVWAAFYAAASDIPLTALLTRDLSPLLADDAGLWNLQALGVILRDRGHPAGAWQVLTLAARGATDRASPDLRAAAAMRLARAACDAARHAATDADRNDWLRLATQQIAQATALAPRCRPPLAAMIRMSAYEIRLAGADPGVTVSDLRAAADDALAIAARFPGRDPLSGVTLAPIGVIHLFARAVVEAPAPAPNGALRRALLHELDALIDDAATPPRWRADIALTLAQGFMTDGRSDHAAGALASALLAGPAWSPKQRRRAERVIAAFPADMRSELRAMLDPVAP